MSFGSAGCRSWARSAAASGTPQARDLFADLGTEWWQWLVFLALVCGWAWVVHACARRALQQDDWVPEAHTRGGLDDESRWRLQTRFFVPAVMLVAVSAGLLWFFDRFHDVRWIDAEPVRTPTLGAERQIGIATAVERWMAVNRCSGEDCPRPILIAGSGGASRAAFLTATAAGAMIDLGRDPATAETYGNLRNRIFALSTVSGSSLGALTIRAALADAAERGTPDAPPCKNAANGSWFGYGATAVRAAGFAPTRSWRDCFQVILAGDFLTPVVLGLAVRDAFPLGSPWSQQTWWDDRAALLEQGFERRYRRLTSADAAPRSCEKVTAGAKPDPDDTSGLCRPFGYHPDPKDVHGAWLPLLFINGTSVAAGRRIIASDVRVGGRFRYLADRGTAQERTETATLFPLAHDINEIRGWAPPIGARRSVSSLLAQGPPVGQRPNDPRDRDGDIRLSTAATMSARFPLISPHGNLRDRTGDVADRVVDGGYFENDGLATAADLVSALKTYGLAPIVIRIVNEPIKATAENRRLGPDRPDIPDEEERTPFDGVTSILRALTAVRSGHEEGHAAYLKSVIGPHERLHEFNVYPLIEDARTAVGLKRVAPPAANPACRHTIDRSVTLEHVSMSWWMSQPVQAYLDAQWCVRANTVRLLCELAKDRTGKSTECQAPDN